MVENFQLHQNSWINNIYKKREKWVPGYWKDTFLAGMSSTQTSEGINFFFKGYMNENSCLMLLVDQFQMALASKVEDEKKLNADSMERPLSYNKSILVEEVFHKAYTNAKFKEVQDEVRGLLYTNATKVTKVTVHGEKTTYEVVEKIVEPFWLAKIKLFKTTIDREGVAKLEKTLESAVGISWNSNQNSMSPNTKVYGRRRLQKREDNERFIAKGKKIASDTLKDPLNCKGKGRTLQNRKKHPSEKGSCKNKKTTKLSPPKKHEQHHVHLQCEITKFSAKETGINLNEPPPVESSELDKNEPLQSEWPKLYRAGVSKGNSGEAGGAGIFRLPDGSFFMAYAFKCDETLTAEIKAIYHGLETASLWCQPRLIIESNSAEACKLLKATPSPSHRDFELLEKCWCLIHREMEVHISVSVNSATRFGRLFLTIRLRL